VGARAAGLRPARLTAWDSVFSLVVARFLFDGVVLIAIALGVMRPARIRPV
jgi:hypothetical protein